MSDLTHYAGLLAEIKSRIQTAQSGAVLAINGGLNLFWQVWKLLDSRQGQEGWRAAVIPCLARDIRNELLELKGFSERILKRRLAFYRAYSDASEFVPQAVALSWHGSVFGRGDPP